MAGVEREFGRSREIMKWHPSSLLPRARSRALIPFPFPFERLPRRLSFSQLTKKILGTLFFVLHDYNVKLGNFLGTRFFLEEILNVLLFTFFVAAAHFHLGGS